MSAEQQLDVFLDRYLPEVAGTAREARARLQAILPGAHQLVYDNYNALVIGFSPTGRPSDALLSLALFPRYVMLCFLRGTALSDPDGVLRGSGKQVRNVVLSRPADLDSPAIRQLLDQALASDPGMSVPAPEVRLVIRSISARRRPRRPLEKPC